MTFAKYSMSIFQKSLSISPKSALGGKRDIFLRISKHTHHTHPRNAKRLSTKAFRKVRPREILTKAVTQVLTIWVSLKCAPMNHASKLQSFR